MCSAPNVYMFVYTLIGAQIVPLRQRERNEHTHLKLNAFRKSNIYKSSDAADSNEQNALVEHIMIIALAECIMSYI